MDAFNRGFAVLVQGVAAVAFAAVALSASGLGVPGATTLTPWLQDGLQRLTLLPMGGRWAWALLGLAGTILSAGLLLLEVRSLWGRERVLVLREGDRGSISVAEGVVRRVVEREARSVAAVRAARCSVREGRRGLTVACLVDVDTDADIPGLSGEIQERVTVALGRQLGLEAYEVRVHAGVFHGSGGSTRRVA